jgi:uncharacterized RDD family membrane protein YckC
VKCPKCEYLGFETGDRCKNCGYDFSLMAAAGPGRPETDLDLRPADEGATADWLARMDAGLPLPEPLSQRELPRPVPVAADPGTPPRVPESSAARRLGTLFPSAADDAGDEPLITLPPAPRPPLAVRRTPENPRLRALTTPGVRRVDPAPTPPLQFDSERELPIAPSHIVQPRLSGVWKEPVRRPAEPFTGECGTPGARAVAAGIDHLMLGGIDLAVVYFTVRMAGLPIDQWTTLPPVPLIVFLLFIKLSYFCAFTAVGGQTIGKMAAHIRVVGADDGPLDAASALRRTLAGLVSAIPLGLGFLPAFLGPDRRALHDRLAHTRVIAHKSA